MVYYMRSVLYKYNFNFLICQCPNLYFFMARVSTPTTRSHKLFTFSSYLILHSNLIQFEQVPSLGVITSQFPKSQIFCNILLSHDVLTFKTT